MEQEIEDSLEKLVKKLNVRVEQLQNDNSVLREVIELVLKDLSESVRVLSNADIRIALKSALLKVNNKSLIQ